MTAPDPKTDLDEELRQAIEVARYGYINSVSGFVTMTRHQAFRLASTAEYGPYDPAPPPRSHPMPNDPQDSMASPQDDMSDKPWRTTRGTKIPLEEPRRLSPMDIERDRRKVERAMRKRARQVGAVDPIVEERIDDYDKTLFGRPVRIEVDVCIPIDDLKKLLNGIRADLTNAILALEQTGRPNDRRFTAHQQLQRARAKAYTLRQELLTRGKVQDAQ